MDLGEIIQHVGERPSNHGWQWSASHSGLNQGDEVLRQKIMAESRSTLYPKDIPIVRLPEHIKGILARESRKGILVQRINSVEVNNTLKTWEDISYRVFPETLWWIGRGIGSDVIRQWTLMNENPSVSGEVFRWSNAIVFPRHDNIHWNSCGECLDAGYCWIDVSSQLSDSDEGGNQERSDQGDSLCYRNTDGPSTPPYQPIVGRFALLVVSILFGFAFAGWGVLHLDDERRDSGAVAILFGFLLPVAGWLLYYADLVPSTWGWSI